MRLLTHAYSLFSTARLCAFVEEQAAPMVMSMRAHSTAVQDSLQDYTFGSANKRQVPSHKLGDSQVSKPLWRGCSRNRQASSANPVKTVVVLVCVYK